MNKFYVITNSQKDKNLEITKMIRDYLLIRGRTCLTQEISEAENVEKNYTNSELIPDDTECIIVLGGDGTLIRAARDTVDKGIALLGINLGTLGYMAEIDKQNIFPALDKLIADEYSKESRMMLEGTVCRGDEVLLQDIALNDIVIGRSGHMHIIKLNIYVDNEYLNSYSADGIIISTPTGSTGYSLSAGGPIVSPQAALLLMTPIAPHTLNTRSIILSADSRVEIEVGEGARSGKQHAEVTFDGDNYCKLKAGDRIVVQKARKNTKIVKISNISFLEVLRKKMSSH